ncbi:hypothetical protein M409DRAFT_19114 [Zasmidium cellare ATCC 36951]|uniref:F-box domain-containing protein n=1 Tax=Zasmidium cellare ATCC 36951 TaxID=1080233 RepID=A0A6A6CWQ8_ZASCE|nr:uncharacterized protein M409DRAFT_19114 [Zasmidium cellare ATCC 36951]KAF2171143.1 hypothetical protein M409DRAFT_19114 [Zasmidium cellare ATCC 36951]
MSHILDLPVEVLQLVANHSVDLTILRLVCRHFNAAFLDAFGKRYLRNLQCFVLDACRIKRLKSITSQPHLVRYIQDVTITFSALEGTSPVHIPMAFKKNDDVTKWYALHLEYRQRAAKSFSNRVPDLTAFVSTLKDLRAAGRPRLHLDFTDYTTTKSPTTICLTPNHVASIFEKIIASGCTISVLRVGQTAFLESTRQRSRFDQYMRVGQSLDNLDIDLADETQDLGLAAIMKATTCLRTLHLADSHVQGSYDVFDSMSYQPRLVRLNTLLTASPVTLRKVQLFSAAFHPSALLAALWSWRTTLQHLRLYLVYLTSRENDWLQVFQCLESSMEVLERFEVLGLMEQSRGIRLIEEERVSGRLHLIDLDGHLSSCMMLRGRENVQRALQQNIHRGMWETVWE